MFSKLITIAFCSYLCSQTKLDSELMIFVLKKLLTHVILFSFMFKNKNPRNSMTKLKKITLS